MAIITFGTSGWRARYDDGFDEYDVMRVATSLGRVWSRMAAKPTVHVGYDTRYRSNWFAQVAAETLSGFGLRVVVSSRACPTPALGWTVAHSTDYSTGIMITGCDAPCDYNGIIARGSDGGTITQAFAEEVNIHIPADPASAKGPICHDDFCDAYEKSLVTLVDADVIGQANLLVAVDYMYGSAGPVLENVLRRMGCRVISLHECIGTLAVSDVHPQAMEPWVDDCEKLVVDAGCSLGIVLDGDGGRSALIDEGGSLVSPHCEIPLLMKHVVENKKMVGRMVATLASSSRVEAMAQRLGMDFTRVPVGFHRIHDEIGSGDVLMAAEEYGGVCIPSHLNERDGILSALLAIEALAHARESVSALVNHIEKLVGGMRYARKDIRFDSGQIQMIRNILPGINPELPNESPRQINHADGLRMEFEDGAWLMLRPSRTQPYIRVYAEGGSSLECDRMMRLAVRILDDLRHA